MTKRSTKTRRRRGAGFTLVELLVAATVAAVVAAAAAAALWQAFRVHAAVAADRPAEADLERLALLEALRADVASAAPLHAVPFRGDARGFSAARLRAAAGSAPRGPAEAVRFAWAPAPDGRSMLRREAAAPRGDPALAPPVPFPAPDGPPRFSYAALVPGTSGTNAPPVAVWADEWEADDVRDLPARVRAVFGATAVEFDVARAAPRPDPAPAGK